MGPGMQDRDGANVVLDKIRQRYSPPDEKLMADYSDNRECVEK